jgi:hypothetical protein
VVRKIDCDNPGLFLLDATLGDSRNRAFSSQMRAVPAATLTASIDMVTKPKNCRCRLRSSL